MGHQQEALVTVDEASQPYEGRWARLISTSNWEKGRIIHEWRSALQAANSPATEFSDEAWSRRVGGVTGQHVGRLRRVYDRFGEVYDQFEGLYWSHFQACIDWDDAEMWLEGAIQNGWSVSAMRKSRWQALGAPDELKPREEDIITSELNEDLDLREDATPKFVEGAIEQVQEPQSPAGPDFGDGDETRPRTEGEFSHDDGAHPEKQITAPSVRPFAHLAELPADLAEAFEAFKLAILRHKAEDWRQIPRLDVLASLDALKELAVAPAAEDSLAF